MDWFCLAILSVAAIILLLGFAGAVFLGIQNFRLTNRCAKLTCPSCGKYFGKKAAKLAKVRYDARLNLADEESQYLGTNELKIPSFDWPLECVHCHAKFKFDTLTPKLISIGEADLPY